MDHFLKIYQTQAEAYHRFIAAEDVDQNLLPALERLTPLRGARVLDLGTGTGRLPLLLKGRTTQITGLDLHLDMLRENQRQKQQTAGTWILTTGDMRTLPFPSATFDVVTAGWAIGHFTGWYKNWQTETRRVLDEMHRVTQPGGTLIILETLSTGSLTPIPPSPGLAAYYAWLENEWGFTRQEIQTDYQFATPEEAIALTEFFFGPALSVAIRKNNWARLPEWTGVWGKRV
ncbi:MAG: class I SAM-dependent methyltransferase [Anaerolineales bacterium]|nr:class I SAM-dependent methyltransferase [Anaerolineales bacterium]